MNDERFAPTFRAHLADAEIDRARLSADNPTEEPIDFRSLRDSYARWLALSGVADRVIQRRMGRREREHNGPLHQAQPRRSPPTPSAPPSRPSPRSCGPGCGPQKQKPPELPEGSFSCAG